MKLTAKQHTECLGEDLGEAIHHMVIRLRRKGFKDPIAALSEKSLVPHSRVSAMYYGEAPQTTVKQMAAINCAVGELLKDGEAT